MKRRDFIAGLTLPFFARNAWAQQGEKRHRVGILTPSTLQWPSAVFTQAMREFGYNERINLALLLRSAEGRLDRLPQLATELVRENVNVMVAVSTPGALAARAARRSIPVVMSLVADPVAAGLVTNLARPEGNLTGISNLGRQLTEKRLELLKEALPAAVRVGVLLNPDDPIVVPQVADTKAAAERLGIDARFFDVRGVDDLEGVFAAMIAWRADAILRLTGQAVLVGKPTIELALKYRLPTMLLTKDDVGAGALMSYDPDRTELLRRTANLVDKILKGATPGELPIEQPTKFELVINLKTAKALGLTIPPLLLARADEVIE
jgi:putative tryptophan/tyrosine transport system substrate-binding protein